MAMTITEVAALLATINGYEAARESWQQPSRDVVKAQTQAWAVAIGDLQPAEAAAAVHAHYAERTQRIMPADVRQRVQALREARIPPTPPLPAHDPDDVAGWLAKLRTQLAAAADGQPTAPALPPGQTRPVSEAVAAAARKLALPAPNDRGWRAVECPHCHARPGAPCTQPHRRTRVIPGKPRTVKVPATGPPRDGFRVVADPASGAERVELVPLEQADDTATRTVQVPPTVTEVEHRPRRAPHPARVEAGRQTETMKETA